MLLLDIGEVCNDLAVLRVIRFIKSLLDVIRIMVPVILTILCMIDFFKALLANEDTKVTSKIVKRFLSAIIIFFIIPVINLFFGMLGESNVNASDCWNNANDSNIEVLAAKEELEKQTKLNEAEAKRKAKEAQKMEESKSVASQGESTGDGDGATSSNIGGYIYYNQGDYSNVGFCKNGKTVKSSGCSAVSFAMVASNLVSSNSNPKSVANWMCSNIHDNGALVADKLINNQLLNQYGLKGERIFGNIGQSSTDYAKKQILENLNNGKMIILYIPGHYVVLANGGSNQVVWLDPGKRANNGTYTIDQIWEKTKNYKNRCTNNGNCGWHGAFAYSKK